MLRPIACCCCYERKAWAEARPALCLECRQELAKEAPVAVMQCPNCNAWAEL
jgi:hypothetical protein